MAMCPWSQQKIRSVALGEWHCHAQILWKVKFRAEVHSTCALGGIRLEVLCWVCLSALGSVREASPSFCCPQSYQSKALKLFPATSEKPVISWTQYLLLSLAASQAGSDSLPRVHESCSGPAGQLEDVCRSVPKRD